MAHHSENTEAGTKPVKSTGRCDFRVFQNFWRFQCFLPLSQLCQFVHHFMRVVTFKKTDPPFYTSSTM